MNFKILHDINDEIVALRTEAFIVPRNLDPEIDFDGRDAELLHFCMYDGESLVAYLRAEPIDNYLHIGRVAVKADLRKNGYGRKLIEYLFEYAKEKGLKMIELSAVDTAQGFYEKLGFKTEGDYYIEANVPHIYMKKMM